MDTAIIVRAFIAGMMATVNPCGHVWIDEVRQRVAAQTHMSHAGRVLFEPKGTEVNDIAAQTGRREVARHVREATQQLPGEHRIVLLLRHDQDPGSEAIA